LYSLGEEIGSGAYARVCRAIRTRDGADFAVKLMRRNTAENHFRTELDVLRRVAEVVQPHPHFARTLDIFEEPEQFAIVMERCTGGSLFEQIYARDKFDEEEAGKVALQLLEAVRALHACGIIHRDIKMENILLAEGPSNMHIKLVDFGTAVIGESFCSREGIVVGTQEYVSPEALGADYFPASDLWGVGVTLFILLSGIFPFETELDTRRGRFEFAEEEWGNISDGAKDLLQKIFVVDHRKRISAEQVTH
jgi:serine/threonine protein kinase